MLEVKDSSVVSFFDAVDLAAVIIPDGMTTDGPYASLAAAQKVHMPITQTPEQKTIATLSTKDSTLWTIADVADWLKAKG